MELSTEELLQKLEESRIKVTEEEAQRLRYPTNTEYVQVVQALIMKYPFLKDLEGNGYEATYERTFLSQNVEHALKLCDEVDRIQPSAVNLCRRWKEGFTGIVPKVVKLAHGKSPLAQNLL
ncbi:hypothetical protein NQZ68_020008 [Dissostichus eleginoides]|nr:hypothetical protein NQZ68_020008 [Dissostichus eleginoides]